MNKLPNNLPQLQNLIKRDPLSYKDEVSTEINAIYLWKILYIIMCKLLFKLINFYDKQFVFSLISVPTTVSTL